MHVLGVDNVQSRHVVTAPAAEVHKHHLSVLTTVAKNDSSAAENFMKWVSE